MQRSQPTIFYINLESRPDRRRHIESELRRLGLEAERVPAVTALEAQQHRPAHLSAPELACSLSHRASWRLMLDRGLPGAVILEDDVVLSSSLPACLAALADAPKIDSVHFETMRANPRLGPVVGLGDGVGMHRLMTSSPGAAAYFITAQFASRMLARREIDEIPIDALLFARASRTLYGSRVFQTVPALAVQLSEIPGTHPGASSDLAPSRAPSRRRTLWQRLGKPADNLEHMVRAAASFVPTGELQRSRRVRIPLAQDILDRFR